MTRTHYEEKATMNRIFWPLMLALALSACGTTTGKQASIEDRTGSQPAASSSATAGTSTAATGQPAATTGVETAALTGAAAPGSALDGKQLDGGSATFSGDPRKDPANPLSQRSVFFDFDSFVVKDEFRPLLEAHAGYLVAHPDAKVILQGNTDERGSREYNLALGQKRAEAVRRALGLLGVGDAQMEAVSFGEEKLRDEGETEEAHAQNRRVDVVYTDE
jgi:peptidoglycan-associated lipoprotein